jgi:hypothetical protein
MAATNITNLRQYALNSEEQIRKRYQDLLMQKYGMGNFDVNKAYTEQTGQALSGWTDIDEKRAAIEYERYLNDIQQAQKLSQIANQLYQQSVGTQASLQQNQELVQKYLGNQLRATGMANSGIADLQQQGVQQQTQRAVQGVKQQTENEANYYLNAYNQAMQEGDWNYANRIAPIAKEAKEAFITGIEERIGDKALTLEDYQKAREVFIRNYNPSPQELQEFDQFYTSEINRLQEQKLFETYGIDDGTYRFEFNSKRFTDIPNVKTRQKDIQHNQKRLSLLATNPQAYEGAVVKLYTKSGGRQTYLIHNGQLFWIKNKHEEDNRFSGELNNIKDLLANQKKYD